LQPFLYSRYSQAKSEAELHPNSTFIPEESPPWPYPIDAWTENQIDHRDEGWTEFDYCRSIPKYFPPLVSDPQPTWPVGRTNLFSGPAFHYPSFRYDTSPMLPTRRDYRVATFSSIRSEFELHRSECLCLSCHKKAALERHSLRKAMRLSDARKPRWNQAQPLNSLRAKHQKVPLRYSGRNPSRTSASLEDDIKDPTSQRVGTASGQKRQAPVQPTVRTRKTDHPWKQLWKNFSRHVRTGRRHYKNPSEMCGSAFAAYCREIRRNHKVEYSLFSRLIAKYGPPRRRRARHNPRCAMDLEPVDETDSWRSDIEPVDP
jgi:hypothetical protein